MYSVYFSEERKQNPKYFQDIIFCNIFFLSFYFSAIKPKIISENEH